MKRLAFTICLCLLAAICFAHHIENASDVEAFQVFTEQVTSSSNIGALTLSEAASDYDWSGICWQHYVDPLVGVNCQTSCTLITARHAIAAQHCGPTVGQVCRFRSPDGTLRTATVEARTQVGTTDLRLIRFVDAPHESLARYPVVANTSNFIGSYFWTPQHTGIVSLRRLTFLGSDRAYHTDGGWNIRETSSGRPSLIPYDDHSFAIIGTAWHASIPSVTPNHGDHAWIEPQIDAINALLAPYSEELTVNDGSVVEIPPEQADTRKRLLLKGS